MAHVDAQIVEHAVSVVVPKVGQQAFPGGLLRPKIAGRAIRPAVAQGRENSFTRGHRLLRALHTSAFNPLARRA